MCQVAAQASANILTINLLIILYLRQSSLQYTLPSLTKQVRVSSRKAPHSQHRRHAGCHSRFGATRRMNWSWIWPPQPAQRRITGRAAGWWCFDFGLSRSATKFFLKKIFNKFRNSFYPPCACFLGQKLPVKESPEKHIFSHSPPKQSSQKMGSKEIRSAISSKCATLPHHKIKEEGGRGPFPVVSNRQWRATTNFLFFSFLSPPPIRYGKSGVAAAAEMAGLIFRSSLRLCSERKWRKKGKIAKMSCLINLQKIFLWLSKQTGYYFLPPFSVQYLNVNGKDINCAQDMFLSFFFGGAVACLKAPPRFYRLSVQSGLAKIFCLL